MRIIAGRWRGRTIKAPRGGETRPTTDRIREAWMNMLAPILPGARVLDLFAGSGALGLEALSRGAARVTFVERAGGALAVLRRNLRALDVAEDEVEVVREDAVRYAGRLDAHAFDIAVADPPYGKDLAAALVRAFQKTAFAALLSVEHRVDDDLPEATGADTRRYGDTVITTVKAG